MKEQLELFSEVYSIDANIHHQSADCCDACHAVACMDIPDAVRL